MTITVWPVDAVSGTPSYTGRMLRQAANGLWTPNDAHPLGARTAVAAGTSTGIVTATSTTWTCGIHRGVLDLEANAIEGAYAYSVDVAVSGAVTAADSTYSRIDIVYVQLSDPAAGDGTTAPSAQVLYLAGAPAASPVAPATPARSMVLAQITVPKAGGGSPSVAFLAPFTVALGGILPAAAAQYPSAPYLGQYVDDPNAGPTRYNGLAWVAPTNRGSSGGDLNTFTAPGDYYMSSGSNGPTGLSGTFMLEVRQGGSGGARVWQRVYADSQQMWTRYSTNSGGSWTAWQAIGMTPTPRLWTTSRPGSTDAFPAGTMTQLMAIALPSTAPAGVYQGNGRVRVASAGAGTGFWRVLRPDGSNATQDEAYTLAAGASQVFSWSEAFSWAGGAGTLGFYVQTPGAGTVYDPHCRASVTYVGPNS